MAEKLENEKPTVNEAVEKIAAGEQKWTGYANSFLKASKITGKIGGVSALSLLAVAGAVLGGALYGVFKLTEMAGDKFMGQAPGWMKDLYKKLPKGHGEKK